MSKTQAKVLCYFDTLRMHGRTHIYPRLQSELLYPGPEPGCLGFFHKPFKGQLCVHDDIGQSKVQAGQGQGTCGDLGELWGCAVGAC